MMFSINVSSLYPISSYTGFDSVYPTVHYDFLVFNFQDSILYIKHALFTDMF